MGALHRVLLVDDEPAVLAALRLAFEDAPGFDVAVATSVAEAHARLRAAPVDLVITDKNLPDGSGVELARALKQVDPRLRVILITGYANAESRRDGEAIGLAAYVEKPFANIYDIPSLAQRVLERA